MLFTGLITAIIIGRSAAKASVNNSYFIIN